MSEKYDPAKIEKKWQERWEKSNTFHADDTSDKQKLYILDMFPYPSGDGLHVGHVEGYTATDIYSRFKRMQGYNVLHPMGWDSFGLPAENFAIKTKVHPKETTEKSIATFKKQIQKLGLSYDWSREIAAHSPGYYKWTQWLFIKFFEKGLVYKKKALVNWDPVDQTVLANEQVLPDGTAERSGAKVEKKELEQWFFKITDYADQLVDDLAKVDWPESTKIAQRNWIGRSEGAEIDFELDFKKDPAANAWRGPDGKKAHITIFTTRPDTLFGATFLVLAPEHPWVKQALENKDVLENNAEVADYIDETKKKTDLERQTDQKDKTGVELKGVKAINPTTREEIPLFIADYALMGFGTGALFGDAHDERDVAFAKKYGIPLKPTLRPADGSDDSAIRDLSVCFEGKGILYDSGEFSGLTSDEAIPKVTAKFGKVSKKYHLRDWLISRQRYWGAPIPIVYDPEGKPHAIPAEHLPWLLPTDVEFKPTGTSPLGQSKELLLRTEKIFGKGWRPEIDTMDTFVCSSWYFYRFADAHDDKEFASKEMIQKWLPVDLYVGGAEHTILHLLYARFFTKALRDMGYVSFDEPFLKLRHQGIILAEDSRKMSKRWGNVINPDDVVERFGADSLRLYEMFMGPLEAMKPWNSDNSIGVRRFLERIWKLAPAGGTNISMDPVIKKVTDDIDAFKFNTAISTLMICLNSFEEAGGAQQSDYAIFIKLLSPFAPHLASELAEIHGIDLAVWPQYNPAKLKATSVKVAIQVNGKVRATIELAPDAPEAEALIAARAAAGKWLTSPEKKAIYVPGKIVNFVV